ncbi:MAG: sulfatase-like hydrolase/transferase [Phycisphaera sp.]|nr:sulfatase-like hydrolase/transferase [Phycisphaera sp.]
MIQPVRPRHRTARRACLACFVVIFAAVLSPARAADKPLNFVLILVDDMGWMDLSCQGSTYYETPNIDKLASQGMRFTDAYAACAVCSPTRAAVLTGRYPARIGVTDWIRARFQRGGKVYDENPTEYVGGPKNKLLCPPNPFWMELDEVTIAEALKPAGYVSQHIGKWHLGDPGHFPQDQGFDFNFIGCDLGQPPTYYAPYRAKYNFDPEIEPLTGNEYLTDREGIEAAKFIKANKDKPFFLYMAHYAVHTPIQGRMDLMDHYKGKPNDSPQKNVAYATMVQAVDEACKRITDALDEAGVADHTVVIFTSDNGGLVGPTNNTPLRSGKGYAYEGGIREPLIIRWPGVVKPGTVSHEPVCSIDFLPTLCELAGVKLPDRPIDGVSLVGHLRSNGTKSLNRDALYWHFPHYRHAPGPYSIIRKGDLKLIKFWEGPTFELFNLKDDLGEEHNLASSMPDKVKELNAQLMQHLHDVGAKLPRPNPDYKGK